MCVCALGEGGVAVGEWGGGESERDGAGEAGAWGGVDRYRLTDDGTR